MAIYKSVKVVDKLDAVVVHQNSRDELVAIHCN